MSTTQQIAALQSLESYCESHPGSPAAVRRPRLLKRGRTWVALLGPNLKSGIAGFGASIEDALRSFDTQYFDYLRPAAAAER